MRQVRWTRGPWSWMKDDASRCAGPEPLTDLFHTARLSEVEVRSIDVPTVFRDFDDYWLPFLGGQAPAPGYAMSLSRERRAALRQRLPAGLPTTPAGEHPLAARAWRGRGSTVPAS